MTLSIRRVLSLAVAEMRICRSLFRFWMLVIVLTLFSAAGYVHSCIYQLVTAVSSPSFGIAEPNFLLGNIDALLFVAFQIGIVLLAFDTTQRHERERILEVLESRPLTNLEFVAGRVLAYVTLFYVVVFCNVAVLQSFGWVTRFFEFDFGDVFETVSIFNLLALDVLPTLLIWSAFVVFLSAALKSRLAAIVIAITAIAACYWIGSNAPYSWMAIVSPSANESAYISDLTPEFASPLLVGLRIATVVVGIALIVFASAFINREDDKSGLTTWLAGFALVVLGIGSYGFLSLKHLEYFDQVQDWADVHAAYPRTAEIDVQDIAGHVKIDPDEALQIDLIYEFAIVGENPTEEIVFSFNPGMTVSTVSVNESELDYTFEDGLLEVYLDQPIDSGTTNFFHIQASGIPDSRFAYIDSEIDYLNNPFVPLRASTLFGRDGSIFDPNYVALMPGVSWYPIPGPIQSDLTREYGKSDFFNVDIEVEVAQENWSLVGPGTTVRDSEKATKFRVKPSWHVPEIGLFASEFATTETVIGNTTFEIAFNKRHTSIFDLFKGSQASFEEYVGERLVELDDYGLSYPYETLSFVEIPTRLRTIGGGWRMDSVQSLPGVVLINEIGLPIVRWDRTIQRWIRDGVDEEDLSRYKARLLLRYARRGLGTDNVWKSVFKQYWGFSTGVHGEKALVLDQIFSQLASRMLEEDEQFSPYSTFQVADMTRMLVPASAMGLRREITGRGSNVTSVIHNLMEDYANRMAVWGEMETKSLFDLPSDRGHQADLEVLLLRSRLIVEALLWANDDDAVFAWMGELRKNYAGQTFSLDEAIRLAKAHELTVSPFLDQWLYKSELPGILVSSSTSARYKDNEEDRPQYQTTFHVRNTEPTDGYIFVQYPESNDIGDRWPDWDATRGTVIPAESSLQVNLVTDYAIDKIRVRPTLSINREPVQITQKLADEDKSLDADTEDMYLPSDWVPDDSQIVVDDLGPGFSANQPTQDVTRSSSLGPLGWLRVPRLASDLDAGLPAVPNYVYRTKYGVWGRWMDESAFGTYRRTVAINFFRGELHGATFATELPEAGTWRLEYHLPNRFLNNREGAYELDVVNGKKSSRNEFNVEEASFGWNYVDEFDLSEGPVNVNIVNAWPRNSIVIADAVRWIPIKG